MGKAMKQMPIAPSPEEVPSDQLSALSKKYIDWKTGIVVVIGVLLVLTFLNVFITNPTVSGFAVVDADTQDTGRFTNMTSLLIVVFAFFGLFLFMITRKLGESKRR
ncbi:hypothetical protein KY359_05730 [Candidatus Woesearchaeota archaeon]|nr:hypothetical protein [Candidatus Woesearchaeota archaeon]